MCTESKIKIGISVGDLNGIGCEVIFKTFEDPRMLEFCTPIIFASNKTILFQKKQLKSSIRFNGIRSIDKLSKGSVNVLNIWGDTPKITIGQETKEAGVYAVKSLKAAAEALKMEQIDALVTAPINKNNIKVEDFNFSGHTNFLAKKLEGKSLMFMIAEDLKVGLLTDHIPVKEVVNHITKELINEKVTIMLESLRKDFGLQKPKIAILGINPHSGDKGTIGNEDDELLKPAIKEFQRNDEHVYGPYSADSFFGGVKYKAFDAVMAAYHDQGLIPFKTLSFGKGVNFTAGLDRIRTSPDHGTAYEIAGKGIAAESSFKEAVFLALKLIKQRGIYAKITQNPLKKQTDSSIRKQTKNRKT